MLYRNSREGEENEGPTTKQLMPTLDISLTYVKPYVVYQKHYDHFYVLMDTTDTSMVYNTDQQVTTAADIKYTLVYFRQSKKYSEIIMRSAGCKTISSF